MLRYSTLRERLALAQPQMIKLGIVGVGKIVQDQHLPSIKNTNLFELTATASRNGQVDGVPAFANIEMMLAQAPQLQAVALCTPPQYRFAMACHAIDQGVDVLLEKPPAASVAEAKHLLDRAKSRGVSLFATWHSRYAAGIASAKKLLADATIHSVEMQWIEDVKKWHPNQEWVWQPGGLGVFDPGINGLSILTDVLPDAVYVTAADLLVPNNKHTPIAALLALQSSAGYPITARLDWRAENKTKQPECWHILFKTSKGDIELSQGGAVCLHEGAQVSTTSSHSQFGEYEAIYREFAHLIRSRQSNVDLTPLQVVADSFMLAKVESIEEFA